MTRRNCLDYFFQSDSGYVGLALVFPASWLPTRIFGGLPLRVESTLHGLLAAHHISRRADSRSNPPMMRSDVPNFSPGVIPGIEVRHRLFRISRVSARVFGGLSLRSESALHGLHGCTHPQYDQGSHN
jgi:hypothetical protein